MDLTGIIAISGKAGLFRLIAQGKNNIIVESLETGKRMPAYASDRISALDDISIYTDENDQSLKEIFSSIIKLEKGGACLSHKESQEDQKKYFLKVLPNYDQERVYGSDIRKVLQWYNMCLAAGLLKEVEPDKEEKTPKAKKTKAEGDSEASNEEVKAPKEKVASKKVTVKKTTETVKKQPISKTTASKKVGVTKTGSSRGK